MIEPFSIQDKSGHGDHVDCWEISAGSVTYTVVVIRQDNHSHLCAWCCSACDEGTRQYAKCFDSPAEAEEWAQRQVGEHHAENHWTSRALK